MARRSDPFAATRGAANRKRPGDATRTPDNVIELLPGKPELAEGDRAPGLPEPDQYLATTKKLWKNLWEGRLASALVPSVDMPALVRLFGLYDEHERARRALRGPKHGRKPARQVVGSQGQPVLSPLAKYMRGIEAEIVRLEDRFGFSPAARSRMAIVEAPAAGGNRPRSLEELNGSTTSAGVVDPRTG